MSTPTGSGEYNSRVKRTHLQGQGRASRGQEVTFPGRVMTVLQMSQCILILVHNRFLKVVDSGRTIFRSKTVLIVSHNSLASR